MIPLEQLTLAYTEISPKEVSKFTSESEFMYLAVELAKEAGIFASIIADIVPLDEKGQPRKVNFNHIL